MWDPGRIVSKTNIVHLDNSKASHSMLRFLWILISFVSNLQFAPDVPANPKSED